MTKPRDPSTLTDADLPTMTDEEEALYYEANAHRLDELFDDRERATFTTEPQGAGLVVSVRMKADEADLLTRAARADGKKLSTWLRETALDAAGEHPKVRVEDLDDDARAGLQEEALRRLVGALMDPGVIQHVTRAGAATTVAPSRRRSARERGQTRQPRDQHA